MKKSKKIKYFDYEIDIQHFKTFYCPRYHNNQKMSYSLLLSNNNIVLLK